MNPRNFFAELKRRNVYKGCRRLCDCWVAAHAGRAASLSVFEIPNWAVRLIVLAIVIGFPISLVIAWAFELTPEGLKRTEDVDLSDKRVSKHRTWIYVTLI